VEIFNSKQYLNSSEYGGVYHLLSSGSLDPDHPQLEMKTAPRHSKMPEFMKNKEGAIIHNLQLASAYCSIMGTEPEYSNLTPDFEGCLDYIWFSKKQLVVQEVVEIPDREFVGKGIPNKCFPSDHVPLVAKFSFAKNGNDKN